MDRKNTTKYLGVILDSKLKFNEHISQICKGLVKVIGAFKINKNKVTNKGKMQFYHAYFHLKINYGIEIYGTVAKRHLKRLKFCNIRPLKHSLIHKYKVLTIKDHYALNMAKIVYQHK